MFHHMSNDLTIFCLQSNLSYLKNQSENSLIFPVQRDLSQTSIIPLTSILLLLSLCLQHIRQDFSKSFYYPMNSIHDLDYVPQMHSYTSAKYLHQYLPLYSLITRYHRSLHHQHLERMILSHFLYNDNLLHNFFYMFLSQDFRLYKLVYACNRHEAHEL